MAFSVIWSPRAIRSRDDILEYLATRDPGRAQLGRDPDESDGDLMDAPAGPTDHSLGWDCWALEEVGCLTPIGLGGVGLAIGWLTAGMWPGIGGAVIGVFAGSWVYHRLTRDHAVLEMGCQAIVTLILAALLIPCVQKVRRAAERVRAERAAEQQAPGVPAGAEQK